MKFYSTKKKSPDVNFKTALFEGIAPDGGLYMPRTIPKFTQKEIGSLKTLQEVGFGVLRKWIEPSEIPDQELKKIVDSAFTFQIPLVQAGDISVLELFHGPTMAFKDIAAGVLARLFDYFLAKENRSITILVATSGDTGGAIAQAFSGMKNEHVVILYPQGKVSELQEEQLTRVGKNVVSIAVDGTFDDCQEYIKNAFHDTSLKRFHLSSANSINIGRLIPQIIYYVWVYVQSGGKKLRLVVPSGNMGNATAALFAYKMGVPIDSLVIATNQNDVVVKYYKTGIYKSKKSVQTLSTAMDIGRPSNFERILEIFQNDYVAFCKFITAIKVSDKKTVYTIKKVFQKDKYLMDFHTAVGFYAALHMPVSDIQTVVISTASPQKFAVEMKKETKITVDNSQILKKLSMKKKRFMIAENKYETIRQLLLSSFSTPTDNHFF